MRNKKYGYGMARTARAAKGDVCYHVLNRGNARATVFHDRSDYLSFTDLIARAVDRLPMRILAYCLMPNHFHLVVWPFKDGDMSRWMQWLLTSHVRRYHRLRGTSGRIWQGRFKAFPIQQDRHLLTVLRYVERNPVRANLVTRAELWNWSSISASASRQTRSWICASPVPKPANWIDLVNSPQNAFELDALRRSANRDAPYGDATWTDETARQMGLESNVRNIGRRPKV